MARASLIDSFVDLRRVFKPFDPEPVNHECSACRLRYIERSA
jgi:hypothetical protein